MDIEGNFDNVAGPQAKHARRDCALVVASGEGETETGRKPLQPRDKGMGVGKEQEARPQARIARKTVGEAST